jgi:hypothetical protein
MEIMCKFALILCEFSSAFSPTGIRLHCDEVLTSIASLKMSGALKVERSGAGLDLE